MEFEKFNEIRELYCMKYADVTEGKMMSSEAIHYKGKVFAFFSKKKKMVFKLGKNYPLETAPISLTEFNPFKNKGPLAGWYEADFQHLNQWEDLTHTALELIQKDVA